MIVKLGQDGKTTGRIFIVLMMVLLIIFLATPASAISVGRNSKTIDNCEVKCTKYDRVKDNDYQNVRTFVIYSFYVGGVKKDLWVRYAQDCEKGHYSRICTPFARCSINHLCEQSGPIRTETKGYWEECGRWDITDVWVATA
ncbi:MAG: hypothetical protein PHY05_02100 [Methanothrix sp.]|nr:hypothetical protein [Methanothrix sp.]